MTWKRWPAEDHPLFALRLLTGGAIAMMLTPATLLFHSGGVFILPIARDTGWDKATLATAIGFTSLVLGMVSPVTGYLVDRFKSRRVAMLAMPAQGVGLILLGLIPHSPGQFFIFACLAAILSAGQMPHAYTLSISSWFDRRRGMALGTILAFTGLGLAIAAPVAAALIAHFGWRMTYVILGAGSAIVGLAAVSTLIADPPVGNREIAAEQGLSWREAIRTKRFWAIAIGFFLIAASVGAGTVHLPVILGERGVSASEAAAAISLLGATTVIARIVFGYLLDRVFAPFLAGVIFFSVACGHIALLSGGYGVWISAVLIGVGLGAETDAAAYLVTRAFGFRNFGQIFGLFFMAIGLGGAIGPSVTAKLVTSGGDYALALICASAAAFAAALAMLLVRPKDMPFKRVGKE